MQDLWTTPLPLIGRSVKLEPLSTDHIPGLAKAGRDAAIWKYMLYTNLTTETSMAGWVDDMLKRQEARTDMPFTVFERSTGDIVGATRYLEMRPAHRSLEIGGTWYGTAYQGTMVNPECKYLLLTHAFERMNCIRVQFKADSRNERSIHAIERLGAVREGILRNHYIMPDGVYRNSVYFSILDQEWAGVKNGLETRLEQGKP